MKFTPFSIYLLAINVVTLLVFIVDCHLCRRHPALDETAANSLILDLFPLAGGAIGMLLALFALGGRGRVHRMNKDNIAWWFLAIICLIVWGFVAAVVLGLAPSNANLGSLLTGWNPGRLMVLGSYLIIVNVVTFAAFIRDKSVAENGNNFNKRIPEARLLALCLLGGSVGGIVAMHAVNHKTKKWYFVWGLPFFVLLDLAAIVYARMCGLI